MDTIIHSNGSKWYGEEPDTIDKLIEVLKTETIEERFFESYSVQAKNKKYEYFNQCPISEENGMHWFFGNFEGLSHVFRIETNDPELIKRLSAAIKANNGWKLYYKKHLVNIDGTKAK